MNLTLFTLSTSVLSSSPLISLANYGHPVFFSSQKIVANNFFNNFIISYTQSIHATFSRSTFNKFLSPPLYFSDADETQMYKGETYQSTKIFTEYAKLFVISCTFDSCVSNEELGGGIHFAKESSTLTVHGTIFNKCKAPDGGGIFACGKKGQTNTNTENGADMMTHENMPKFNSQYCCYSFCTSISKNNDDKNSGYGSAVLVAANDTNLNYSSTYQCPSKEFYTDNQDSPSYGAQFDLKTKNIDSCNINATSGYSRACSAIEYRDAQSGRFQFQTVVEQKGGFITSFTRLTGELKISECNFINNTVKFKNFWPTLNAVIHVRMKTVTIENFCFFGISFEGFNNLGQRRIASKGSDKKNNIEYEFNINIKNCLFDESLSLDSQTFFDGITTSANSFPHEITTKEIDQLKLGNCEGEKDPPRTFESNYFTLSYEFTKSNIFTKTEVFTPSIHFSNSNYFSPSSDFTKPPDLKQGEGDKKPPIGPIVGGVVGGVAAAAVIAFLIVYFVRKSRLPKPGSADVETITDSTGSVENKNPLYNNAEDDPFKEDFEQ